MAALESNWALTGSRRQLTGDVAFVSSFLAFRPLADACTQRTPLSSLGPVRSFQALHHLTTPSSSSFSLLHRSLQNILLPDPMPVGWCVFLVTPLPPAAERKLRSYMPYAWMALVLGPQAVSETHQMCKRVFPICLGAGLLTILLCSRWRLLGPSISSFKTR